MVRQLRRAGVLVVVLISIVALSKLPADAAPAAVGIRHVSGSNWPLGGYQVKTDVVSCPAGFKVVGGGEDNNSGGGAILQASEPLADGSGWRIAVRNTGWSTVEYRAWAMCASGLTNYSVQRSDDVSVAGRDTRYIVNTCTSNPEAMLGFGFHTDVSAAVGRSFNWSTFHYQAVTKITNFSSDRVTASTLVICGDGYVMGEVGGPIATARAGEAVPVTATCPAGSTLVGGGTALQEPGNYPDPPAWYNAIVSSQPLPIDSYSATTWRTTLYNKSTDSQTVQAQAVCAYF